MGDRLGDPRMSKLLEIYRRLLSHFGPQGWWNAETAFEVLVRSILTQRTTWQNAARALENLRRAGLLDPAALASAPADEIESHIRCAGLQRQKAERLRSISRVLVEEADGSLERLLEDAPTDELRRRLLSWKGVGPETADAVLLYAGHRRVFPIDLYTVRIVERLGLGGGGYSELQRLFTSQIPAEIEVYREFHALIDELGMSFCRREPRCGSCPLRDLCRHAAQNDARPSHPPSA